MRTQIVTNLQKKNITKRFTTKKSVHKYSTKVLNPKDRVKYILENGLYDKEENQLYRTGLNIQKASTILNDRVFWEAAKLDVAEKKEDQSDEDVIAYINKCDKTCDSFWRKEKLVDREEVLNALTAAVSGDRGNLVLYLGGKSVGKSFLLKKIAERRDDPVLGSRSIILIDGRKGQNLSNLLAAQLPSGIAGSIFRNASTGPKLGYLEKKLSPFFGMGSEVIRKKYLKDIKPQEILQLYVDLQDITTNGRPIIIIDEANSFLEYARNDTQYAKDLREYFELCAYLSKQTSKCDVILASSEHSFPYRFKELGGGNFSSNITKKIFAGEIPPKEMINCLTEEWGMGENLASVFVACYGGHMWNCSRALKELAFEKEMFTASSILGFDISSGVIQCLKKEKENPALFEGMTNLLEIIAKDGFTPLADPLDPRAELMSQFNVCGLVEAQSTVIGVARELRENSKCGLVPSSQMARLLIAEELTARKALD